MTPSSKKVEFTPPDHGVPEGVLKGEDFDVTCTFRVKDDGKICLVMFGDIEMPGYRDKSSAKEERPSYDRYRKEMMAPAEESEMA